MNQKVEDYSVNIMMDNPPSVGSNIMEIIIIDKTGKPVRDAKVQVDYGMGAKAYRAALLRHASGYHTELNITKKGSWYVNVTITRQEKTVSAKFTFDIK